MPLAWQARPASQSTPVDSCTGSGGEWKIEIEKLRTKLLKKEEE
jgi:hypothetical protein